MGDGAAVWLAGSCRYAEELLERERSQTGIDAELATGCDHSPARALHDRALREGSDTVGDDGSAQSARALHVARGLRPPTTPQFRRYRQSVRRISPTGS